MTLQTAALVALAAALGACARYLLDFFILNRVRGPFPVGIFIVNVTGSFALGVLAGLVGRGAAPEALSLVLGTGFLGAYTTFSAWMYESVRLIEEGVWGLALLNLLGSLLVGTLAAALGLWLGGLG